MSWFHDYCSCPYCGMYSGCDCAKVDVPTYPVWEWKLTTPTKESNDKYKYSPADSLCEHGVAERNCVYCEIDHKEDKMDSAIDLKNIDLDNIKRLVKLQQKEKHLGDLVGRENTLRIIWKELGIE